MSDTGKETLLGAALHYNPELKREVEEWLKNIVRNAMSDPHVFENMMSYNERRMQHHVHKAMLELHKRIDQNRHQFF